MKTILTLLVSSLIILITSTLATEQEIKAVQLVIQNTETERILEELTEYRRATIKPDDIYIIKVERDDDIYRLRIAFLSQYAFSILNRNSNDSLVGFFDHKGHTALVYSKCDINRLFKKTTKEKVLDFIQTTPIKDDIDDSEPPMIFEPTVWVYNLVGERMVLEKAGYFKLLD